MKYYGAYSKKQEEVSGCHYVYLDENGEEVVVTEVSKNPTFQSIKWDDVKKKGIVTKWVRTNFKEGIKKTRWYDETLRL